MPNLTRVRIVLWLGTILGLDTTFLLAVLGRIIPSVAGLLTTILIGTHFPAIEQGYFYSFISLLSLQTFVELGLGQVIVQFAAHEWAHLSYNRKQGITGDQAARSRLASLARLAMTWFSVGAFFLLAIFIVGGFAAFGSRATAIDWQAPWFGLCLVTVLNVALLPVQFLLEGCNQLRAVYLLRALQALGNSGGLCVAILAGIGLWAAAAGASINLAWTLFFVLGPQRSFYKALIGKPELARIHWRSELWPMQWRIAISTISGFFMSAVVTPMTFRLAGPIAAGQLGMSMTFTTALLSISALPIAVRAPSLGMAIARKDYVSLDRIMFRAASVSFSLWLCGAAALAGGLALLRLYHIPFAHRLLSEPIFLIFLLSSGLQCMTSAIAVYLRAHKREPFMVMGVVFALGLFCAYSLFGTLWGIFGLAAANLGAMLLMTPITWSMLIRYRNEWHS
jgi:hypothetical protein